MDVGKSFTFMFEDPNWIAKLAIGGGIILLGVLFSWLVIPAIAATAIVVGYALIVTRNVYDGNPTPLPEWSNIGDMFVKGITALVGVLIWSIPLIVLSCCIWLVAAATGGAGTTTDTGSAQSMSALGGLLVSCLSCLVAIVGILIALFVYAPLTNFALTNQISTFWDFQGNWRFIQNNMGNYLIAFLLALVANFIAGFGIIACFIGVFFTTFWGYLVSAHLFGQVARANLAPTDSSMMPPPTEPPTMPGPLQPMPPAPTA